MANVSFAGKSPIDGQVIETNVTVGNGTIQAVGTAASQRSSVRD